MTLLKTAREYEQQYEVIRNRSYTDEEIELAIAWLRDEVTLAQVTFAKKREAEIKEAKKREAKIAKIGERKIGEPKTKGRWGGPYCFIAMALREGIRKKVFHL